MTDEETKEINLEQCVNKNYSDIELPECADCEGYNYNCPSYYSLKQYQNIMDRDDLNGYTIKTDSRKS
jgi:hypothetical protein